MAVLFNVDEDADRYLQKTLGIAASQHLIHKLHYDLFCWVVRFFKEKQKEEYKVAVSSATGEVIGFSHAIEDTASRPLVDKEKARQFAFDFLKTTFAFNPATIYVLMVKMLRNMIIAWNMLLVGKTRMWIFPGTKAKRKAMPNF